MSNQQIIANLNADIERLRKKVALIDIVSNPVRKSADYVGYLNLQTDRKNLTDEIETLRTVVAIFQREEPF